MTITPASKPGTAADVIPPCGPRPKVFSYVRFSTPEQALGDSRRRQVEAAQAWAAARGMTLDDELRDEGVSGFRGANLSAEAALGSFTRAVDAGLVPEGSVLIVESLDRLSRDRLLNAQHLLTSLLLKGIKIVTLSDEREYSRESVSANPIDLIASLLVFMRANEESDMKARRLRAVWDAKRGRAASRDRVRMTSTAPAWLAAEEEGWRLIEERAVIIRRVFAETLEGKGQAAIARGLTTEGVAAWEGGRIWHPSYVRKILDNPAVIGTLIPHVTERLDGGRRRRRPLTPIERYYPAVVDAETWARARALLGTRLRPVAPRGRHAGAPVRSLLARLARCPICGHTMTRVHKGSRSKPRLVCTVAKGGGECQYRSVPQEVVEGGIFQAWHLLVDEAPPSSAAQEQAALDVRQAEVELEAIENELEEFSRRRRSLTTAERAARASLYGQMERVRSEREAAVQRLADSGSSIVEDRLNRLAKVLSEGPAEDLSEANRVLMEAVSHIVVDYRGGHLVFHWRHGGTSRLTYAHDWG